jgi:hypothetical protein
MSAHLPALHLTDSRWASTVLLPFFDWAVDPIEARGTWEGYLWTPRINAELLDAFKASFLDTARHYANLGKHNEQYASLLTIAALELRENFSTNELRDAFSALPKEGLAKAARTLARSLGSAGDRRADYWTHRIKPLIETAWPKSHDKRSSEESAAFAELCVYAGLLFPEAFKLLNPMLVKTKYFDLPVQELAQTDLPTKYPLEALLLLDAIADEDNQWPSGKLGKCLEEIGTTNSDLRSHPAYRRLREYLDRYGRR